MSAADRLGRVRTGAFTGLIGWLLLSGCAQYEWAEDLSGPLPERLSESGWFDPADRDHLHPRAIPFAPAYPLWSNGSEKHRFLLLPEGVRVDNTVRGEWAFPVGTLVVKTFSYDEQPVETRVLRHTEDGWELRAYAWDEDGLDATLLDGSEPTLRTVSVDGETFEHAIPSERQCRTCHEANGSMVIGFSELQLARDGASVIEALADRDVFLEPAPAALEHIDIDDALTHDAVGYLQGNCVHCHNGTPGPANAFDMRHPVALENLVGVMTTSRAVEPGLRVAPGDPDASALYRLFAGSAELEMPPLGVQRRDAEAAERLRQWIASLE